MRAEHIQHRVDQQGSTRDIIKSAYANLIKVGRNNLTTTRIQNRLDAVQEQWHQFNTNHQAIQLALTMVDSRTLRTIEERSYFSKDLYKETYELYLEATEMMQELLAERSSQPGTSKSPDVQIEEVATPLMRPIHNQASNAGLISYPRLSKIDVPKFNGTFSEWLSFKGLYMSLVYKHPFISDVEKLQYLKTSLVGPAAFLLKGTDVIANNLQPAWEAVFAFYENERRLVNSALKSLFSLKKMTKDSAKELETLYMSFNEVYRTLESLNRPVQHCNDFLVFMMTQRLDPESVKAWEIHLGASRTTPTWQQLKEFLESRLLSLQSFESSQTSLSHKAHLTSTARTHYTSATPSCPMCTKNHHLYQCDSFLAKAIKQRREYVLSKGLCFNCTGNHKVAMCQSPRRCRNCGKKHHTKLHLPEQHKSVSQSSEEAGNKQLNHASNGSKNFTTVLLATAQVFLKNEQGEKRNIWVLLDPGSEISLVSERMVQTLRLPRQKSSISIIGVGNTQAGKARGIVNLTLSPHFNPLVDIEIQAFVLPKLTSFLPSSECSACPSWNHLQNLQLADPSYKLQKQIDLIIGADYYGQLLEGSVIKGPINAPVAQLTILGWIVSDPANICQTRNASVHHCSIDHDLNEILEKFWIQEELPRHTPHHYLQRISCVKIIFTQLINESRQVNALNDSHAQLMVHWLGDGSDVMICLARDQPLGPLDESKKLSLTPSSVFFSFDYGDSFVDKTHLFRIESNGAEKNSTLDQFSTHPKYDTIIFTDSRNKAIFYVQSKGDNVKRHMVDFTPSDISFYENDPKLFLVLDKEDPERKLYLTTDAGATFTLLQTFVKSFSWSSGEDNIPTQLYVERKESSNTSSIIFITAGDLMKENPGKNFHVLIQNVQDFHIKKDFMFVVRKIPETTHLFISYKRGPFIKADFQTELSIKGMHIATVEGNRIMVAAAHSEVISHLFVSETNEELTEIKFVPSLENIFSYIPDVTWTMGWIVQTTDEPFTDLYKVEGLQGIFIASKLSHISRLPPEGAITPEHLVSVITFDHGGSWQPLAAPKLDSEGQFINCTSECSLHLFQKFNQLYPFTRSVTILSSKLAPGIILAPGVLGKSLKGHPGVFMSRDAGLTWRQVLKNYYFFNFGDHGGIIVAVKYYKSKGETREILFSTDEGETWTSQPFHTRDLKLYSLMTEPNTNTTIFTLFGSEPSEHRWLIIKVDLKNAFSRNCTQDDYKMWSPRSHSGESLMPCVLGKQQTFQRRMPNRNCLSSKDYIRLIKTDVCACDSYDFECDYGFTRSSRNAPCVRNRTMVFDPYAIPDTCQPGDFYSRSRGYKKILGDECVGGYENRYLPQQIPCPINKVDNFLIIAQRDHISRIDLSNGDNETLPISGLKNVIAIDYDMKHNCVFWADIMSDMIGRQCLDGNHSAEILVETELASVEGMSYDWISELLFFVDGTRTRIEAVKTSSDSLGRMRTTVIDSKHLVKPRGIVVHPIEGYLFWTEWSSAKPSLSRSNLDGSNIISLFTKPDVEWPNGVTIDYIAQRVYWVDASKDYIASCDLNGKSFVKILDQDSTVAHPFAVAVYKDLMYWDDWKFNAVFQANKDHGIMVKALTEKLSNLMDLKVYAHSLQEGKNACSKKHNCSHICVGAPRDRFSCLCPEGMIRSLTTSECLCPGELTPNVNKTCPQLANTCAPNFFTCDNKLCIPALYRCDSENDCGDNSDEIGCVSNRPACPPHMFTCKTNNKCIPEYFACDFDIDCPDKSDEEDCKFAKCAADEFTCTNKRCITKKWLCDGEDDCRDGSDEAHCQTENVTVVSCKPNEFPCLQTGHCISNQWRCDNDFDCSDGSDEHDCGPKECEMWQLNCGDGKCIYQSWKCDGDLDCTNGLDEENCTESATSSNSGDFFPSSICHDWMFKCGNDKCIPMWWKCDKVNDCEDDTDEIGCNKNETIFISTTQAPVTSTKDKCLTNQFECDSGTCLSERNVCDGMPDCPDAEDEQHCSFDVAHSCGPSKLRCRTTNVCVPLSKYCDGVYNCADRSDEEDCARRYNDTSLVGLICSPGQFQCDNFCFPLSFLCDSKQDCYDGSDEEHCAGRKRIYQVNGLDVENRTINATSFVLSWWVASPNSMAKINENLQYLPSIAIAGTNAWQNHSVWVTDHKYRFVKLKPYTSYNVTVFVRAENESPVPPYLYFTVKTVEGVPSEPLNINVKQLNGSLIQISWDPPKEASGVLHGYTVFYRQQKTTSIPARSVKISAQENATILGPFFKPNITYTFWVRARNSKHESPVSKMVSLTFNDVSNIDSLKGVSVTFSETNSITLKWSAIKGAEGYVVQPTLVQPYPRLAPIKTNESEITLNNLVAGVQFVFQISAYIKNYVGQSQFVKATLKGEPLPEISHLSTVDSYDGHVVLMWKEPKTNYKNLTYAVYYGTNVNELFERARLTTNYLSVNLTNLIPCGSYLVSVGIIGPVGPGPLGRNPITIETSLSEKSKPINLQVNLDPNHHLMTVSWEHGCPYAISYPSYTISLTDLRSNRVAHYTLKHSNNKTLTHFFHNIPPNGVKYKISVAANSKNYEDAFVIVQAPTLNGPRQLQVWPEKNGTYVVYWKEINPSSLKFKFVYELVIYEGLWSNNQKEEPRIVTKLSAKHPPIFVNPEDFGATEIAGQDFTLGVRIKSEKGFVSLISETEHIIMQSDETWSASVLPSKIHSWLLIVPIVLIFALVFVIVFLIQRHRRLQNSFSRFANPHYDTKTGATRIGDTIDEDEQGHQGILRSADDEPLVLA